jgi:hypothetical protein
MNAPNMAPCLPQLTPTFSPSLTQDNLRTLHITSLISSFRSSIPSRLSCSRGTNVAQVSLLLSDTIPCLAHRQTIISSPQSQQKRERRKTERSSAQPISAASHTQTDHSSPGHRRTLAQQPTKSLRALCFLFGFKNVILDSSWLKNVAQDA